jgi:catechol 2,3-dioxygenase-like lactoylglutathione lyase family enzyme
MQVLASRVLLQPADFERSVDFYERRLGLVRFREWGSAPHRGIVYFLGGGYLELNEHAATTLRDRGEPGVRLWLQVADASAAHRQLRAAGVETGEEPELKPWGLIEFTLRDPDRLELVVIETPITHPLRRRD